MANMEMGSFDSKGLRVDEHEDGEKERAASSTSNDLEDMRRLGKQQQFQVSSARMALRHFTLADI